MGSAASPPSDELTFTAQDGMVNVELSAPARYTPAETRRLALEAYAQADLAELQVAEQRGPLYLNGLA